MNIDWAPCLGCGNVMCPPDSPACSSCSTAAADERPAPAAAIGPTQNGKTTVAAIINEYYGMSWPGPADQYPGMIRGAEPYQAGWFRCIHPNCPGLHQTATGRCI